MSQGLAVATIVIHLLLAICVQAQTSALALGAAICVAGVLHAWGLRRGVTASGGVILGVALVIRVMLWSTPATLSDDLYRYLWDGRVQAAGINPYAWAPDAPELESLRDPLWAEVNHPSIPTIYPPVAQFAFRIIDGTWHDPASVKAFMAVADLLTICVLLAAFGARAAIAYGWCPLVVVEFAGNGHMDAIGILLCVVAVALLTHKRPTAAAWAAGLATATKLTGLVFLPALLRRGGVRAGLVCLGLPLLLYLPHGSASPWSALETYARTWEFNGLFFPVLRDMTDSGTFARGLGVCAMGIAFWKTAGGDPVKAALAVIATGLAFSPVVHPWYVAWALPFAAILGVWTPFVLAATVTLSYEVLDGFRASGTWESAAWIPWAVYMPVFLALALEWSRRGRVGRTEPQTT